MQWQMCKKIHLKNQHTNMSLISAIYKTKLIYIQTTMKGQGGFEIALEMKKEVWFMRA